MLSFRHKKQRSKNKADITFSNGKFKKDLTDISWGYILSHNISVSTAFEAFHDHISSLPDEHVPMHKLSKKKKRNISEN